MLFALLAATLSLSTSSPPAQDPEPKPAVTEPGDVVTVTYARERAISVEHVKP